MNNIEIKNVRKKYLKYIALSLLMTVVSMGFFVFDFSDSRFLRWIPNEEVRAVVVQIIGTIGLVFFGVSLALFIIMAVKKQSVILKIDDQGFTDNSNRIGLSMGFVPWSNVSEIYVYEIVKVKYIYVTLIDTETWIDGLTNERIQKQACYRQKKGEPLVCITVTFADKGMEEIANMMKKAAQENTGRNFNVEEHYEDFAENPAEI